MFIPLAFKNTLIKYQVVILVVFLVLLNNISVRAQHAMDGDYNMLARNLILMELEKAGNEEKWDARNYLIFMMVNYRMNFEDMVKFKKGKILNPVYKEGKLISGKILYPAKKGGFEVKSELSKPSLVILNRYKISSLKDDDYVFPMGIVPLKKGVQDLINKRGRFILWFNQLAKDVGAAMQFKFSKERNSWYIIKT